MPTFTIKPFQFIEDENGCHICVSHFKDKHGYIRVKRKGINYYGHRLVYEDKYGPIPKGAVVRHKCDVPSCINPDHLELGSHQDNVKDRVLRKRSAVGERNGRSKLTETQVLMIKNDTLSSKAELSRKFGVDSAVIRRIQSGKLWRNVVSNKVKSRGNGTNRQYNS